MMTPTVLEVNKFSYVYAGEALDKANNSFVTITPNSHVFVSARQEINFLSVSCTIVRHILIRPYLPGKVPIDDALQKGRIENKLISFRPEKTYGNCSAQTYTSVYKTCFQDGKLGSVLI